MLRISLLCFLTYAVLICESNTPDNNLGVEELHLFDGDIVLSSEQRQELHWGSADGDVSSGASREARAVVKVSGKKWLDREIPYQLSSQLKQSAIDVIVSAMDRIMFDLDRRVTFRQRLASDEDYLVIFPGDGCYSLVGRQGGAQDLSIGSQCESKGVVMHELIHALGRWHEQSRPDRNSYVEVQEENIKEGFSGNFQVVNSEEISTQGLPYDYDSIMHYDAYAFSSNDEPTLRPLDSMVALDRLGQRARLSEHDKEHIRLLYPRGQWSRWSSWSDCSTSCGGGRQQRSRDCLEGDCDGTSEERRDCNTDSCPIVPQKWGPWSDWSGCSRSCGGGTRVRIRSCLLVEECEGHSMDEEKQDCNVEECPGNAEWSSWSKWTLCSESCGGGVRYRSRTCISKANTIFVSNDQLFCTGEAIESRPCFTNISCDLTTPPSPANTEEISCQDHSCFNNTCLAGLMGLGCYYTPATISSFVFLQLTDTDSNTTAAKEDDLRMCGEYAQQMNLMYFSLRGDECYCSHNVTDFIQAGPSQTSCEGGCAECIQVYQITEQENFELSVQALEGCGPGYCLQQPEDRTCSGGVWSVYQLAYTLQISLLLSLLLLLG